MTGSVHQVIEALRELPSNSERGTAFEKLMVRYFELDPVLSQQYEKVWRWIDWPGRDGKVDTGIDLVAQERDTGELTAVQCKFYEPTHTLSKADIDSFFTASGKKPFTNRVIISTTDHWSSHAEEALENQLVEVQRIGLADIADSPIDWDIAWPDDQLHIELSPAAKHQPKPYQQDAIDKVIVGFQANDRGQMIMACGTGKTFTALKIAEKVAHDNGDAARVLFLVPSISLLSQTLREWTAQTTMDLRAFGVCSDSKVSRAAEDFKAHDVAIPVTTDAARLAAEMGHRRRAAGLTVVFSTYQSLPTVADAQAKYGVDSFDLVICDEAHRTTGVTLAGEDESNFVRIHDAGYIRAAKRLYMTATPRIYDEKAVAQAEEHSAQLASMDDEDTFGPEFFRLPFGAAVEAGLLTDYKVLVLTVDESVIAGPLQQQLAYDDAELKLDDASKIIGCFNGLAKRAGTSPTGAGFPAGATPMRRAVAFARDIKSSQQIAEVFPQVVDAYRDMLNAAPDNTDDDVDPGGVSDETASHNLGLRIASRHVDGTFNALERGRQLTWLKAPVPDGECRILSNARCLSEGVDVPALDAVLFLHPRNSVVDVVQSVGRVMRKSAGKNYGYIILPVAVPAGIDPATAMADNKRFKVVWQVLNALRAHDERFDAMVNSIRLNKAGTAGLAEPGSDRLLSSHIGPADTSDEYAGDTPPEASSADSQRARQIALFSLAEWQEAIFARIVDKVGTRVYWEQWATDVADIASALTTRIHAILEGAAAAHDEATLDGFAAFHKGLQDNLNNSVTAADAVGMLAQHLITSPVFDALFAEHEFASHNPVSKAMQHMADLLDAAGLDAETEKLAGFYASVRARAAQVTTADGKQALIADLYEKFFRIGFAKQAEALGIVFTPIQVVDFILRAADQAMREEFGRGLTDKGVHILDGFTGSGTFITRLLQSGLIDRHDLARKYASELHANEITLLAYYIAAVNIETTYHALTAAAGFAPENDGAAGDVEGHGAAAGYMPFEGIVLADTFQITEAGDSFDEVMFPQNNERITRQLATPIQVIVGNPPYSVGQGSANDLNANTKYPTLDGRIAETYAKRSTAILQRNLYDSYVRALRWATDRIGDSGVVAFVTNGGWIESNSGDGIRLSLADEYTTIHVVNLKGNMRKSDWKREGGQIFGAGSQATIAIVIGIKNPAHTGPCVIRYRDIGDYLTREDKLAILNESTLDGDGWTAITPNAHGDWIRQRDGQYGSWPVIGDKKAGPDATAVFDSYSLGLGSNRDAWVYNFSRTELKTNVQRMIDFYNQQVDGFDAYCRQHGLTDRAAHIDEFIETDSTKISWTRPTRSDLARSKKYRYDSSATTAGTYRPFCKQHVQFDRQINNMVYQLPAMFPTPHHPNLGFLVLAPREGTAFATLATNLLPDLSFFTYTAQFFPRWMYEKADPGDGGFPFEPGASAEVTVDEYGYRRIDNITDGILNRYRDALGTAEISKDDVFYYVYGLLHNPVYRERYAADLKKMLPHIPDPESANSFNQYAAAGRALAELHVNYETVEPYPLDVQVRPGAEPNNRETWRVDKMRWGKMSDPATGRKVDDPSTIAYNGRVTITGIPAEAHRYMLGSRSALGWILDRYQVKTDKASGIVNDPNDWCDEHDDPTYIVDLLKKITTVSVETMRIVDGLPGS